MREPEHAYAVNGSLVRPDGHGECVICAGLEERNRGVRATVPVFCYDGYQYDQADSRAKDNSKPAGQPDIRTPSGFSVVPTKWLTEFRAACDTLCRRLGTLGSGNRPVGSGDDVNSVPGGGLRGHGPGTELPVRRATEEVGTKLPRGYPLKCTCDELWKALTWTRQGPTPHHHTCPDGKRDGYDSMEAANKDTKALALTVFGCGPRSCTDDYKCTNWPECERCGPPRL